MICAECLGRSCGPKGMAHCQEQMDMDDEIRETRLRLLEGNHKLGDMAYYYAARLWYAENDPLIENKAEAMVDIVDEAMEYKHELRKHQSQDH